MALSPDGRTCVPVADGDSALETLRVMGMSDTEQNPSNSLVNQEVAGFDPERSTPSLWHSRRISKIDWQVVGTHRRMALVCGVQTQVTAISSTLREHMHTMLTTLAFSQDGRTYSPVVVTTTPFASGKQPLVRQTRMSCTGHTNSLSKVTQRICCYQHRWHFHRTKHPLISIQLWAGTLPVQVNDGTILLWDLAPSSMHETPWDVNADGDHQHFGSHTSLPHALGRSSPDLNGDGIVNILDLVRNRTAHWRIGIDFGREKNHFV